MSSLKVHPETPEPIRIFGSGVRARMLVDLIAWQFADRYCIEGYYDDCFRPGQQGPGGFPILGTFASGLEEIHGLDRRVVIATGTQTSAVGCRLLADLRSQGVPMVSLVSPAAHVSPSVVLGENVLVFPGVFLGADVRVGDMFCAHSGSVVEHHGQLGHNVLLGPGVTLAGFARVGSHSFLGAGCVLTPERKIGIGSLVGAGSLVVKDVPPHVVAYGSPAVLVRPVRCSDDVPVPAEITVLARLGFK